MCNKVVPFEFAGDRKPAGASCWKTLCVIALVIMCGPIGFIGYVMFILPYDVTPTPDVKLAAAAVSSGNASSLLIDADWLLTFHVIGYYGALSRYAVVEGSVLYDVGGGGGQFEVAVGRLPPFDAGLDSKFSLRLRSAAEAGQDQVLGSVLDHMAATTGSVGFRVRFNASCGADYFFGIHKPMISIRVDCDPVRIKFPNWNDTAGGGGGRLLSGSLAEPTSCHVDQIR